MKPEDISNAVGRVNDKLLAEADEQRNQRKNSRSMLTRVTAAAAAVVLIVTGAVVLSRPTEAYEIVAAQYPEMAPYPGDEADPLHETYYQAWNESRKALRNQPEGYRDGIEEYFISVIRQFMTGLDGENRVFSPLSLYSALTMTAETADGESREQILNLLGYEDVQTMRERAKSVWEANYTDDGATKSILANSLWLNNTLDYNPQTMDLLAGNYYASAFSGAMGSEEYRTKFQEWLNGETGGLLSDAVESAYMTEDTVLSLVSAVNFSAKWVSEFNQNDTEDGVFHGSRGDEDARFMIKKEITDVYYWADDFAAYEMDLENTGSVWFVLPDEDVTPETVLEGEDFYRLLGLVRTEEPRNIWVPEWEDKISIKINLSIPKFRVQSQLDLTDGLAALGVTDIFNSKQADFTPLTDGFDGPVWLDQAQQAVTVEIDEEGCSAAAYTMMRYYGAPQPPEDVVDFVCDRPFIFVVMGNDNLPLFTGVVNSVTES